MEGGVDRRNRISLEKSNGIQTAAGKKSYKDSD
jgi:hypothetical protein